MNNLVSVIIPIHNRFSLVEETIDTVFHQTYRPIEMIIVDDCSDEPYIPQRSSEPGFEVILLRHNENKGPGASRETGRQAASGDFIAYLDSDDLWHPEKINKQVKMLEQHRETGMCYCISSEFTNLPITGNEKIRRRSDLKFDSFLPTIFNGRPWSTGSCLWTKEAADSTGPWINAWVWEDYEYECRAGCKDIKICFLPEILCYIRKGKNNHQISSIGQHFEIKERLLAINEMTKNLIDTKQIDVPEIRNIFYLRVLRCNLFELLSYYEYKRALVVCADIRKINQSKLINTTVNFLVVILKMPFNKLVISSLLPLLERAL